jgi:hypothetical protein
MRRRAGWIVTSLLGLALWVGPAQSQPPPAPPPPAPAPGGGPAPAANQNEGSPALAYGAAMLFTLVILLIVCMPSRKS